MRRSSSSAASAGRGNWDRPTCRALRPRRLRPVAKPGERALITGRPGIVPGRSGPDTARDGDDAPWGRPHSQWGVDCTVLALVPLHCSRSEGRAPPASTVGEPSASADGTLLAAVLGGELLQDPADGVVEGLQGADEVLLWDGQHLADAVDRLGEADHGGAVGGDP